MYLLGIYVSLYIIILFNLQAPVVRHLWHTVVFHSIIFSDVLICYIPNCRLRNLNNYNIVQFYTKYSGALRSKTLRKKSKFGAVKITKFSYGLPKSILEAQIRLERCIARLKDKMESKILCPNVGDHSFIRNYFLFGTGKK